MQEHNLGGEWHPERFRNAPASRRISGAASKDEGLPSDLQFIDIGKILTAIRRQTLVLIVSALLGIALGALYLSLSSPSYIAFSQVLIDVNAGQVATIESTPQSLAAGETDILNKIEVLRSSRLALEVVRMENLATDPAFLNPPPSFLGKLRAIVTTSVSTLLGKEQLQAPQRTEISPELAAGLLRNNVMVERVGRSFVVNLGYRSFNADLSYRIANAYATAFVQDQLNTNLDAARTAADWMQGRLSELSQSQLQATQAIEAYRSQNGLSLEDDETATTGRLGSLTQELVQAQSETAQLRAQSSQLQSLIASGVEAAAAQASILSGDGVDLAVVTELRNRKDAIQRRIQEITDAFGPDHPQIAPLKSELASVSNDIFTQFKAMAEYYANQVNIADRRETELRASLAAENSRSAASNQARAQLNELQQRSAALTALYTSFSSRYEELVQRQSFPIPTARIISAAERPAGAAGPNVIFTMLGSIMLGLFIGIGFAFLNEVRERAFRIGDQINQELHLRFIGYLPRLAHRGKARRGAKEDATNTTDLHASVRKLILTQSSSSPSTAFNETLRSSKRAIDALGPRGLCQVVGIVSALPGEGKTTVAVAFAEMLAAAGSKVVLVDADLRHQGASRVVAQNAKLGLFDIEAGTPWRQALITDDVTGLAILPAFSSVPTESGRDFIGSPAMMSLLDQLRDNFDYVILDLPPLGPAVDALVVMPWTDSFLLVINWGKTPRRLLRSILDKEPALAEHIRGAILNNVEFSELANFSEPGGAERFIGQYGSYYELPVKGKY